MKKLVGSFSVSGREQERALIVKEALTELGVEATEDKMGNIIAKLGKGSEKWMISTHLDAVGLLAIHIEKDGTVKTSNIGNFSSENYAFCQVKAKNGLKGRYIVSKGGEALVDFGFTSGEEAAKKIKEGDSLFFVNEAVENNGKLIGAQLNSVVGCFALINIIKELNDKNIEIHKEVYFVFSVEHQLGGRGARAAAYGIAPDYALILQGCEASSGKIQLGAGPVLSLMDKGLVIHHEIKELVEKIALKDKIKLQYSISKDISSDGALVHKEKGGIKTGVLSFPVRYFNSPAEMINLEDVAEISKLINKLI